MSLNRSRHPVAAPVVLLIAIVFLNEAAPATVESRWAEAPPASVLSIRHRMTQDGRVVSSLAMVDLKSNSWTEVHLPESLGLASTVGRSRAFARLRLDPVNGRIYFVTESPFRGLWAADLQSGETRLISRWRVLECTYVDERPETTPSGDTVMGSLAYVTRNDVAFDVGTRDGTVYWVTTYAIESWYPGCKCADSSDLFAEADRKASEYHSAGKHGWNTVSRLGKHGEGKRTELDAPLGCLFVASPGGSYFATVDKNAGTIIVTDTGGREVSVPRLPSEYCHLLCEASFSPDERTLAAAGYVSRCAVLVSSGPDFQQFEVLTEVPGMTVSEFQWTSDGEWLIASVQAATDGCAGGGERYLLAIEPKTRESVKIPFPMLP